MAIMGISKISVLGSNPSAPAFAPLRGASAGEARKQHFLFLIDLRSSFINFSLKLIKYGKLKQFFSDI